MILPKRFRQWVANTLLKRKLKSFSRKKQYFAWDDFKTIGILCRIENEGDFNSIKNIAASFKKSGKEVQVVAYIPEKIIPDYLVSSGLGYFFNMNDISAFLIPKSDFVHGFMESSPDILLDLSFSSSFVIKYILALSRAKMKIGNPDESKKAFYDLILSVEDEKDKVHFVEQMKYYLNVIKSK